MARPPLHLQLATRDAGCLKPRQRQSVEKLREQLRQHLDTLLCSAGFVGPGQTGIPALKLVEHSPLWLANYPLNDRHRCEALLRLLTSANPIPTPGIRP
jgi:hypothetical protein